MSSVNIPRKALLEDSQLIESRILPEVIGELSSLTSSIDIICRACKLYGERPALGYRQYESERDVTTGKLARRFIPRFSTLSYSLLWQRAVDFASGLCKIKEMRRDEFVGILGTPSVEYVVSDIACLHQSVTSVPLSTSFSTSEMLCVVNETKLGAIICGVEQIHLIESMLPQCPSLHVIIVMDICYEEDAHLEAVRRAKQVDIKVEKRQMKVFTFQEIEERGYIDRTNIVPHDDDALVTICYTSGSTGFPKGALYSEELWKKAIRNGKPGRLPYISVTYAPLSHLMGRLGVLNGIFRGGVTYFTLKNDMSTLFQDIQLVRPTFMVFVPRISEMIYQHFQTESLRRILKLSNTSDSKEVVAIHENVKLEMRNTFLGDRLMTIITGSAPTSPAVLEFLRDCFQIRVYEGYGSTEGGNIIFENKINREEVSHYKLVDVPELGYNQNDIPFPRGELVIKSHRTIPGYFNDTNFSSTHFDSEGYFKTGDIFEERAPDTLFWIDRKNNVIKLSQGEYVALWRIESIFQSGSPFIHQVFLYGNSLMAYVVGIIVPNAAVVNSRFQCKMFEVDQIALKQLFRSEIDRIAVESQLRPYEVPRDFFIETIAFSQENGMLTSTNKLIRRKVTERFGEKLEELYHVNDKKKRDSVAYLSQMGPLLPIQERVKKAIEASLGVVDIDWDKNQSFRSLGGDSLAAVSVSMKIEEISGVFISVSDILNSTLGLKEVVRQVQKKWSNKSAPFQTPRDTLTYETIHASEGEVHSADFQLERIFTSDEVREMENVDFSFLNSNMKTVLLTGSNGFLGRFLGLELLEHFENVDGKLYCLVRGNSDQDAFQRLSSVYKSDKTLEEQFKKLMQKHLTVLAGDLSLFHFGLAKHTYETLVEEVDTIIHAGALVNHVLPYRQLFETNVLGTVQIIRFALTKRPKWIHYISTQGVTHWETKVPKCQSNDVHSISEVLSINSEYGNGSGYVCSKWVCEVLLRNVYNRFQLPITIYRTCLIMPHEKYRKQINVDDVMTRLLCSVICTGLAPRTFYTLQGMNNKTPMARHFDGLPVGFISSAIISVCKERRPGFSILEVCNSHHDDGITLDRFVDWTQSKGYSIEIIGDYEEWYTRIMKKLKSIKKYQEPSAQLVFCQWKKPQKPLSVNVNESDCSFRQRVHDLRPGGARDIPHITEEFIHKYMDDMKDLGIIA